MGKWIAWAALAGVWLFTAGFLVGRAMPASRFEKLDNSRFLYDSSTGRVCRVVFWGSSNPFDSLTDAKPNPIDQAVGGAGLADKLEPCPSKN